MHALTLRSIRQSKGGARSPQHRQVQESSRNGFHQIAFALPVMHTGYSSKRRCPVFRRHHVTFVTESDIGVLPMLFQQWHTAKRRVDVCLSKQQDAHSAATVSGLIMMPTFQGVRSGPTAFSRALKTASKASSDSYDSFSVVSVAALQPDLVRSSMGRTCQHTHCNYRRPRKNNCPL